MWPILGWSPVRATSNFLIGNAAQRGPTGPFRTRSSNAHSKVADDPCRHCGNRDERSTHGPTRCQRRVRRHTSSDTQPQCAANRRRDDSAWQSALSSEGVAYTLVTPSGTYGAETMTLPALSSGTTANFDAVVFADSPFAFASGQLTALDALNHSSRSVRSTGTSSRRRCLGRPKSLRVPSLARPAH